MRNQLIVLVALSATVLVPICGYAKETSKTTEKSKVQTKTTVYKTEQKAEIPYPGSAGDNWHQETTPKAGADRYQSKDYASAADEWRSDKTAKGAADRYRNKNINGNASSSKLLKQRI